ncbi:MAG: phenylalanine--tRNA ligase subunit alpha [Firmicutes bacterium]|jgi:phenylalanyl-tRNA synthetase alpha chain|nr:phenylalanine--tRNA ligase subunit alpha [Bacillota bacterium]MEE3382576.1 phenylalanine--tRNA ligase subunit alpha [Anaerovoracaceae bacterium]MBQ1430510.1 phenylalanine--tRNA ligase subunit alpha [Bacillota bacterium]MBQ1630827.1 phenylalanine--tRNA ligase subunit alpha [Bacillota bacterium]MBQ1716050.1 phenylalanine--tRNA ligase subunit alpha [Bacillota bacterium]
MKESLQEILNEAKRRLEEATSLKDAEDVRIKVLGKKGDLTSILKSMGGLSPEERKQLGMEANTVKAQIEQMLKNTQEQLKAAAQEARFKAEKIDVTEPGKEYHLGTEHPVTITINEISEVFKSMGFTLTEGPEIETVYNNFDALNAGPDHPARDWTDTFYINDKVLLRTQTSPVQVRTLQSMKPPIRVFAPGRCFRCDTPDATHSPMFHQVEGLVVDEGITMADLKGVLDSFAKKMFGSETRTKFRPHHFPFTEPSAEMDVSCFKCGGRGCRVCKGSGWIEILGCGMVHPSVLKVGGIDTEKYTGFAFGLGVERVAMLKHEIDDIRLLYENDMRFIEQFK